MTSAPKKLIEVALPLDDINREAAREKSIRHGHPSTLHLWWARRPLAACRAVLFAQLVDDPSAHPERFPTPEAQAAERERLFAILRELVKWENSNNEQVLEAARAEIRRCYPDGPPPIVDPFCGGGSIPLEAQRLGLEVHASDLNPVAVLITKALVELPAKFAGRPPVHPSDGKRLSGTQVWAGAKGLAEDVRWYGQWMRDEAERRIGHLYPKATLPDGSQATVIAWLWARTVTCPNPACGSTMPLVRSFWLGKKKGKEAWVNPIPDPVNRRVWFEIGHGRQGPPIEGTVGRTGATCLVCDTPVPLQYVRKEGRSGRMGAQLMAIVAEGNRQRVYLPPTPEHERAADVPRPEDTPDTELPAQALGFRVQAYGMTRHADLFTPRQLTALCTFSDLVTEAHTKILADSGGDTAYADAVATYLTCAVSRSANYWSSLTPWGGDFIVQTFGRQALPMVWDFAEANCFSGSTGNWDGAITWIVKALLALPPATAQAVVFQSDALQVDCKTGWVATDPPYYDNIGYADLSDYFYVWWRRSARDLYATLFSTVLVPKAAELIASPYRHGGDRQRAEIHFRVGLERFFSAAYRSMTNEELLTLFYAFKQQESIISGDGRESVSTGWETMLEGVVGAGFVVTGTWPLRTERDQGLKSGDNVLASSILLVCRPRPASAGATDRRGFLNQLKERLRDALADLRSGGVAPVDLAQAAIGPGMAVFSSYARVVEPDGSPMRVRTALALINQVLDELEAEHEGEFDEETRWATAWYAEFGFDEGPFGRADDLARAKNVAVDGLVRAGIATSRAGKVRLLERSELPADWDPTTDTKLTVWEVTQHLIRILLGDGGEREAAALVAKVGGFAEPARDLAYRLFELSERRGWAKEAGPYNALAAAWPELTRLAASSPTAAQLF